MSVFLVYRLSIYNFHCVLNSLYPLAVGFWGSWLKKIKVEVLHLVQQPGSYWDRSSALSLVGVEPTHM